MSERTETQNSHLQALLEDLTTFQNELAQYSNHIATLAHEIRQFHISLTHSYDQASTLTDEARQMCNDTAILVAQSRLLIETLKKDQK